MYSVKAFSACLDITGYIDLSQAYYFGSVQNFIWSLIFNKFLSNSLIMTLSFSFLVLIKTMSSRNCKWFSVPY